MLSFHHRKEIYMKPLIILTDCDKEGYIRIKKEEFEKVIQNAYEEGKRDCCGKTIMPHEKELTIEDVFHFFDR